MFSVINISSSRFLAWLAVVGLVLSLTSCRPPAPSFSWPLQPGETVYFVPNTNRMVVLTFDDGPNGVTTERILDILKRFHVPATFFLVGTNVTYYPEITRRIAREGHEIGNHTFSHPRFDRISIRAMLQEIIDGADAIANVTGVTPTWFRPPYGINGVGLKELCRIQGLTIAGWSGHASDWNPHSAEDIAERIIMQATPGDILLLHDGWETRHNVNRQSTVDAVPLILERLTREGFQFVTLPELIQHATPPLAEFANGVRLLGLHVQTRLVSPGDVFRVRYFWDVPIVWNPRSASVFVHVKTAGGFRFQSDHSLPRRGDVRDLTRECVRTVPSNAPAGKYQGNIGMFDPMRPGVRHRVGIRASMLSHRKGAVIIPHLLDIQPRNKNPTPG